MVATNSGNGWTITTAMWTEGASNAEYTLNIGHALSEDLTIAYTLSIDGGTPVSGSVTIPAGLTSSAIVQIPAQTINFSLDSDLAAFSAWSGHIPASVFSGTLETDPPNFISSVDDLSLRLGESLDVTLPASITDSVVTVVYSVSGLPNGLSFDASTRVLSGSVLELGSHTVSYTAKDITDQEVSVQFTIQVAADAMLVQDIMWRQALFIADMSVTSVKKRFDLVGVDRLPHYLSGGFEGANFRVGMGKWLGLWLNSQSGSLSNSGTNFSWDSSTSNTQLGIDFSAENFLVGLMSESVSFSTSYNKNAEGDLDYSGSFDVSGLSLLSFYGGYKADKYNIWAVSSSGSGSATLTANVDGTSNAASSGVDYAMTALGGSYHINDLFDVGYEMVSSASLDFAGNKISTHSSNGASRSKIFGSIDFGKWTRASKPKASNFSWAPSLTFASRSDSGDTSAGSTVSGSGSASGFETTIAVELEFGRVHFEFGNRNFSADNYSESGQWFTFQLAPSERGGLNVSFSQRAGAAGSRSNDLLSADYVASLSQDLSNGQNNSLENKVI